MHLRGNVFAVGQRLANALAMRRSWLTVWSVFVLTPTSRSRAEREHPSRQVDTPRWRELLGADEQAMAWRPDKTNKWRTPTGEVQMATDPLNPEELLKAAGDTVWRGFPEDGCIGHVHQRVGDIETADRFIATSSASTRRLAILGQASTAVAAIITSYPAMCGRAAVLERASRIWSDWETWELLRGRARSSTSLPQAPQLQPSLLNALPTR